MTNFSALGDLLREARFRAGWTQYELARRAGITESYVSALETGRREPSPDVLNRLGRALQVPLGDLFQTIGLLPPSSDIQLSNEEEQVIRALRRMPPALQRSWIAGLHAASQTVADESPGQQAAHRRRRPTTAKAPLAATPSTPLPPGE